MIKFLFNLQYIFTKLNNNEHPIFIEKQQPYESIELEHILKNDNPLSYEERQKQKEFDILTNEKVPERGSFPKKSI